MKSTYAPLPKELKTSKVFSRKLGKMKTGIKNVNTKRQRMITSITAGHIRGGHSFH